METQQGALQEARPHLAVTMGDPAGVGPEIVCKALASPEVYRLCRPVVFGDIGWMRHTAQSLGLPLCIAPETGESRQEPGSGWDGRTIFVRQATNADLSQVQPGQLSAQAGRAGAECVISAAKAAL